MGKQFLKAEESQRAFDSWMQIGQGAKYNPCDDERFFEFAIACYKNKEIISEEQFIKEVKRRTHITRTENRGIAQKYYRSLLLLIEFQKKYKSLQH